MELDELEKLAKEAHIGDGVDWLSISDLAPLSADDAAYIAAANPAVILRLVVIARAAKPVAMSNGFDAAFPDKLAALREALSSS